MNLLLLAHLVADGGKAAETSSGPVWATWVPATIGLLGSLGVAWWSGRKIDKQMELSKQATPPELTRYKEWLEISGKYKELVNSDDVDSFLIFQRNIRELMLHEKPLLNVLFGSERFLLHALMCKRRNE